MSKLRTIGLGIALLGLLALPAAAQLWTGVLNAVNAANWAAAGVTSAYATYSTTYTKCAELTSTASATTINSTLAGCAANTYVLLDAGTYNLTAGIQWGSSNVVLRGQGADKTFLVFAAGTTAAGCNGLSALVCIAGPNVYFGSPGTIISWTGGYSQGSTSITLGSTSGITTGKTMLMLDQCDDGQTGDPCAGTVTDTGGFFACSAPYSATGPSGCAGEASSNAFRPGRSQIQIDYATAVAGTTVTLGDAIVAPQWRTSQTPEVWLYQSIVGSGIEDLSIDATAANLNGIQLYGCFDCWVTGNRVVDANKEAYSCFECSHTTISENYSWGAQDSDPYCYHPDYTSFMLWEDNIGQACRSQMVKEGPDVGSVFAYNYFVFDKSTDSNMWFSMWDHSATSMYNLYEGNISNGRTDDNIHGSHDMQVNFRNYWYGWEPGKGNPAGNYTHAFNAAAYARYDKLIGNVFGTSGYHTTYKGTTENPLVELEFGIGGDDNAVPEDPLVETTAALWGNYDVVTAAVRWCGSSTDTGWTTTCNSTSEIPSGLSSYPLPLPTVGDTAAGMAALPASFFLSAKPSWWGTAPWPAIGPDVTGGTVYGTSGTTTWVAQSVAGHANDTPALNCFKTVMGGPADGSGSALTFNAASCYSGTAPPSAQHPRPFSHPIMSALREDF